MFDFLLANDFLSAIIAFILVLIPAVIIHELGHFLAAKAVGITVLEFGIGFPPRAAKLFNWGETEFTLNWLPLGGFVRPLGEDMIRPQSEAEVQVERERVLARLEEEARTQQGGKRQQAQPVYTSEREELAARGIVDVRSINEVKPLPRIFFMAAGALANFLMSLALFFIIGLIGVPQPVGARVQLVEVGANTMFAGSGLQDEDYVEALNGEPFPSREAFFEQLAALDGEEVSVTVRREEADEPLTFTFTASAEDAEALTTTEGQLFVLSVVEGSPAEAAGIVPRDVIVGFAGVDLTTFADPFAELQRLSAEYAEQQVTAVVLRDGETVSFEVTPRADAQTGRVGVSLRTQFADPETGAVVADALDVEAYIPLSLGESVSYAFMRVGEIFQAIAELPGRIIQGITQPGETRVVSVFGVSQLGGEFLQESIRESNIVLILDFIAVISISLGITNLLPIPALDGGRILFVLVEMIRGRPIAPEREGIIHLIGLAFLLSIGVIFILNDILNPITDLIQP